MELKTLKLAQRDLKNVRKDQIRNLIRAGCISHFGSEEHFLVGSINELWGLICDVADRKLKEAIKIEATRMVEEAGKEL